MTKYTQKIIQNADKYGRAVFSSKETRDEELNRVIDQVERTKEILSVLKGDKLTIEQRNFANYIQSYYHKQSKFIQNKTRNATLETLTSLERATVDSQYNIFVYSLILILYTSLELPRLGLYTIQDIIELTNCRPEEKRKEKKLHTDDDIVDYIEDEEYIRLDIFTAIQDIQVAYNIKDKHMKRHTQKRLHILHKFFIPHPKLFPYRLSYRYNRKETEKFTRRYFPEHYPLRKAEKYFNRLYSSSDSK